MNFSLHYKPPTVRILDTSSTLKATSMSMMNSPLGPKYRPFEAGVSSIRRCLILSGIYNVLQVTDEDSLVLDTLIIMLES